MNNQLSILYGRNRDTSFLFLPSLINSRFQLLPYSVIKLVLLLFFPLSSKINFSWSILHISPLHSFMNSSELFLLQKMVDFQRLLFCINIVFIGYCFPITCKLLLPPSGNNFRHAFVASCH